MIAAVRRFLYRIGEALVLRNLRVMTPGLTFEATQYRTVSIEGQAHLVIPVPVEPGRIYTVERESTGAIVLCPASRVGMTQAQLALRLAAPGD